MQLPLTLVLDDVRSAHNVGAILRTAAAFDVKKVVLCGLTPTPPRLHDSRLPHVVDRALRAINKTALGATELLSWEYQPDVVAYTSKLKQPLYVLEQAEQSTSLLSWRPTLPLALVVGSETQGVNPAVLTAAAGVIEIPMPGHKESLNVSVAAAIATYHLTAFA
jgi:23S rRNA (guanosine2251-2'-O)-methyltransferase